MISDIKKFGSYLKTKCSVYDHYFDDNDDNESSETEEGIYHETCIIPNRWTPLQLISIFPYNFDTSIFEFSNPKGFENVSLGLPALGHLLILAPRCEQDGSDAIRPYTSISPPSQTGSFHVLVKRYDQWGTKETPDTHFLFTKTDHSYRPPGAVSNYIHSLKLGDTLMFKFHKKCVPPLKYPFENINAITMLAVGAGISPMIRILNHVFSDPNSSIRIVLLYGVRDVKDILCKEKLDDWHSNRFINGERVPQFVRVYCIGSRWANIHMGAKTSQYIPPNLHRNVERMLGSKDTEIGWITEEKIKSYAFPPGPQSKVFVCGLPGVYEKICGSRFTPEISEGSALYNLGYTSEMVLKF